MDIPQFMSEYGKLIFEQPFVISIIQTCQEDVIHWQRIASTITKEFVECPHLFTHLVVGFLISLLASLGMYQIYRMFLRACARIFQREETEELLPKSVPRKVRKTKKVIPPSQEEDKRSRVDNSPNNEEQEDFIKGSVE